MLNQINITMKRLNIPYLNHRFTEKPFSFCQSKLSKTARTYLVVKTSIIFHITVTRIYEIFPENIFSSNKKGIMRANF